MSIESYDDESFEPNSAEQLKEWLGDDSEIDLNNPQVIISSNRIKDGNYQRGSIVYPIGDRGQTPGAHFSEDWISVSTLNAFRPQMIGFEKGKAIVSLDELIELVGKQVGLVLDGKDRITVFNELYKNRDLLQAMLSEYIKQKVPSDILKKESLSSVSSPEKTEVNSGIICNTLDDIANALRAYEKGVIRSSNKTRDVLMEDVEKNHGVMGVGILLLAQSKQNGSEFVEKMIKEINAKNGSCYFSYDYDGQGRFFKTSVKVEPIDGKYILKISAAYVGRKPEMELAKAMGAETGLVEKGAEYKLSKIDNTNWTGVDMGKILKGILTDEEIENGEQITECAADIVYEFQIDGVAVNLRFYIQQEHDSESEILRIGTDCLWKQKKPALKIDMERIMEDTNLSFSIRQADNNLIIDPALKAKFSALQERLNNAIIEKLS